MILVGAVHRTARGRLRSIAPTSRNEEDPIGESAYQPDSGKWKVNKSSAADRVVIKGQEADYFYGEE